jgi:hypothetical protein
VSRVEGVGGELLGLADELAEGLVRLAGDGGLAGGLGSGVRLGFGALDEVASVAKCVLCYRSDKLPLLISVEGAYVRGVGPICVARQKYAKSDAVTSLVDQRLSPPLSVVVWGSRDTLSRPPGSLQRLAPPDPGFARSACSFQRNFAQ